MRKDRTRGAAMVETAISVFLALAIFLFGIDIIRVAYQASSLQYVVSRALRWGSLGNSMPGLTREASIATRINQVANEYGVNLSNANISICPMTQPGCTVNNAGGPNELIIVRTTRPTSLFWNTGTINLSASVIIRNEPYA